MMPLYVRDRNTLRLIATGEVEQFKSINLAKRRSREIQQACGGLGLGAVTLNSEAWPAAVKSRATLAED